jgi:hypothetical protein
MTTPAERDAATWVALTGLVVIAVGLVGLMALVAPHVLGIVLILGGFLGFGAFHYLVWGWWLGPTITKYKDRETDEPH